MQTARLSTIKKELVDKPHHDLIELCLRLSKFKKENKELLSYLLFLQEDKQNYLKEVKNDIDNSFEEINRSNFHLIKKSIRKILREIRKQIRFSADKEVEIELLLYFVEKLLDFKPNIKQNTVLLNLYSRTLQQLENKIDKLHEDLQYDFNIQLEKIKTAE